ncbi:MAG TPA: hypothetical protein VJ600_11340 [Holophagaceae bacterium]|nr:hypothetical protein [Holophagaceae bacterium]
MRFAKRVYALAGIYGLLILAPQLFLEARIGHDHPPAITHLEYFYGFLAVCLPWQLLFLAIAKDPGRYRPVMPFTLLEKAGGVAAFLGLWALGRIPASVGVFGFVDGALGILFWMAWRRTATASAD